MAKTKSKPKNSVQQGGVYIVGFSEATGGPALIPASNLSHSRPIAPKKKQSKKVKKVKKKSPKKPKPEKSAPKVKSQKLDILDEQPIENVGGSISPTVAAISVEEKKALLLRQQQDQLQQMLAKVQSDLDSLEPEEEALAEPEKDYSEIKNEITIILTSGGAISKSALRAKYHIGYPKINELITEVEAEIAVTPEDELFDDMDLEEEILEEDPPVPAEAEPK